MAQQKLRLHSHYKPLFTFDFLLRSHLILIHMCTLTRFSIFRLHRQQQKTLYLPDRMGSLVAIVGKHNILLLETANSSSVVRDQGQEGDNKPDS